MDIDEIRKINRDAGQHFFDPETMIFFSSEVLPDVYDGPGGVYFITSEQFESPHSGKAPCKYTVRKFDPKTGRVSTHGAFNRLTLSQAQELAEVTATDWRQAWVCSKINR